MGPQQSIWFVGVSSSQSSINRVFPRWADALGLEQTVLNPLDLPIDSPPETYRKVLADIRDDPSCRGALVTTHKVRLLEAGSDMFDQLDDDARLLGEVSCISKRDGLLLGSAKDPTTSGRALRAFVPHGHFGNTGASVLSLGAGGAGLAIAVHLLARTSAADRPARLVLVSRSAGRLEACRSALHEAGVADRVDLVQNADASRNDEYIKRLPDGSLVINATGMGKDRPGSPITDRALFPAQGLVWELNYRGELQFLQQARRQAGERSLCIEDGWRYFVHGWSEVIAEVFELSIDAAMLQRLSDEAAAVRE